MLRSLCLSFAALSLLGTATASVQGMPTPSVWGGAGGSVLKILALDAGGYRGVYINYALGSPCFAVAFDVTGHNTKHGVALEAASSFCSSTIQWWGQFPAGTYTARTTWLINGTPVRGTTVFTRY
jgi:hypothetical protein